MDRQCLGHCPHVDPATRRRRAGFAVVDSSDPVWQVAAFLLGGGATLMAHGAKAGMRAVINASPEPFSNVAMSGAEDLATVGGLWLLFENPEIAAALAIGLILLTGLLL
jgi:hypothetical protein